MVGEDWFRILDLLQRPDAASQSDVLSSVEIRRLSYQRPGKPMFGVAVGLMVMVRKKASPHGALVFPTWLLLTIPGL